MTRPRSPGRVSTPTRCDRPRCRGAGYANYAPVDETPERVRAAFGSGALRTTDRREAALRPRQRVPIQPERPAGVRTAAVVGSRGRVFADPRS